MQTFIRSLIVGSLLLVASAAHANDKYHVYKLSNGECEIDTRDHTQFKNQRGTDNCIGHGDYRTDAEKIRHNAVQGGSCKCPSGNNC
jgi:hypothetical protein